MKTLAMIAANAPQAVRASTVSKKPSIPVTTSKKNTIICNLHGMNPNHPSCKKQNFPIPSQEPRSL
jgi:hypothetical protein